MIAQQMQVGLHPILPSHTDYNLLQSIIVNIVLSNLGSEQTFSSSLLPLTSIKFAIKLEICGVFNVFTEPALKSKPEKNNSSLISTLLIYCIRWDVYWWFLQVVYRDVQ